MTHYSNSDSSVRVSYFKPSGKWYMDEALDMEGHWYDATPVDAVRNAILAQGERGESLLKQFIAVVLSPYSDLEYPVMLIPEAGA